MTGREFDANASLVVTSPENLEQMCLGGAGW